MRYVTFETRQGRGCGYLQGTTVVEINAPDILSVISQPNNKWSEKGRHELNQVTLLSPIPRPPSMRDGYAFRQHVMTARRNRGLEMIPEFDQFPVF
jgi:hypothetical protein